MQECTPVSLVTFVGKTVKSNYLRYVLKDRYQLSSESHGEVRLWTTQSSQDTLLADCEIHFHHARQWQQLPPSIQSAKDVHWPDASQLSGRRIGNYITSRILAPLSNVLCFFASDFNGLRSMSELLAEVILLDLPHDLGLALRPRVIIVVSSASKHPDTAQIEKRLFRQIENILQRENSEVDIKIRIDSCFSSIRVVVLADKCDPANAGVLSALLRAEEEKARQSKNITKVNFNLGHFSALSKSLVEAFCIDLSKPFSFIHATRPHSFNQISLYQHLGNFLSLLPCESWLWHVAIPLLSSALLLASYPPNSHRKSLPFPYSFQNLPSKGFDGALLFNVLYRDHCERAIRDYSPYISTHEKFLRDTEHALIQLTAKLQHQSAVSIHRDALLSIRPWIARFQSNFSCFLCLLGAPEKVLDCGHTLCNTCIRIFGVLTPEQPCTYMLTTCPLCSAHHSSRVFSFMPPTAGARVLSMDGGGVRGIIILSILSHLEQDFSYLGRPLRDFFDFVIGTSSGKALSFQVKTRPPVTNLFRWLDCNGSIPNGLDGKRLYKKVLQPCVRNIWT